MNTYEMYKNTTVEKLTNGLVGLFDTLVIKEIDDYKNLFYNIDTANSEGLDLWGQFLKFPRYVTTNEGYERLEDSQYRVILKAKALQMTRPPTINGINKSINDIFGALDIVCYIRDTQDMSFVTYVFIDLLPDWLRNIFEKYDILPRPAGVGVAISEAERRYIGFFGQNSNGTNISNFTKVNFHPMTAVNTLKIGGNNNG